NEETEVAKPTLKPDIFKWLEGGHLNPGMTKSCFVVLGRRVTRFQFDVRGAVFQYCVRFRIGQLKRLIGRLLACDLDRKESFGCCHCCISQLATGQHRGATLRRVYQESNTPIVALNRGEGQTSDNSAASNLGPKACRFEVRPCRRRFLLFCISMLSRDHSSQQEPVRS
ncbi:TPA: hypothetical protein ACK3RU_008101, partial [Burkholderia cepacia]